jgi:DNA-binding NtrC family response regulator
MPSGECIVESEIHNLPYRNAKKQVLQRFHAQYLGELLRRHHGNVSRSARECGLERQALQQIMRRCGVKSQDFRPKPGSGED